MYVIAAGGSLLIALKLLVAVGLWTELAFTVYLVSLLWMLGIAALCFSIILIRTIRPA